MIMILWLFCRKRKFLFWFGSIALFAGCLPYYRSTEIEPLQFLAARKANPVFLQTLSGTARIQVENKLGNYLISQKVFYRHPDKLRFETTGIFGMPMLHTLIKDNTIAIFVPIKNILVKGQFTGHEQTFSFHEIIREFFQGTSLPVGNDAQKLNLRESSATYLFTWEENGLMHKAWLNKRMDIVTRYEIYLPGKKYPFKRLQRGGFVKNEKGYFPRKISLYDGESHQKIIIVFVHLEVNPLLAESVFTLPLPAYYEEKDLQEFLQSFP